MTDKQLENLYNKIVDFDEFMDRISSKQDILTDELKIKFLDEQTIEIALDNKIEKVTADYFETVKAELNAQRTSDKHFNEIKKNKIYDNEINIRDNGTFIITDRLLENIFYGRQISSGYTWAIGQIKQIIKLLDSGYVLIHNDRTIRDRQEFIDKYLETSSDFESLEKELW